MGADSYDEGGSPCVPETECLPFASCQTCEWPVAALAGIPGGTSKRPVLVDSVEKPATEIEAGAGLGTVWKARPGYASAGAAGIGISFANLRRF